MITLHGYTFDRLHQLARSSASNNYTLAADYIDLYAAAHGAMIDLLLSAEQAPSEYDLRYVGKAAIWQLVRDHRQTYGYRDREWGNGIGSAPRFNAFWSDWLSVAPSHETRIVERVALFQVLQRLKSIHQAAIVSLAVCDGDRDAAAAALRIKLGAFNFRLQSARAAAVALWHEHETPHRNPLSRPDHRRHRGDVAPCGSIGAAHRHRDRKERLCGLCAPVEAEYDRERKGRYAAARSAA